MKDQNKIQVTNGKFLQDISFIGDQLQITTCAASESFKNSDTSKRTLLSGLQKKINPRLLIL